MKTLISYSFILLLFALASCAQKTDAVSTWKNTVSKIEKDNKAQQMYQYKANEGVSLEAYTVDKGKVYWICMPVEYPKAPANFCCSQKDTCPTLIENELAGNQSDPKTDNTPEASKSTYTIYFGSASIAP